MGAVGIRASGIAEKHWQTVAGLTREEAKVGSRARPKAWVSAGIGDGPPDRCQFDGTPPS